MKNISGLQLINELWNENIFHSALTFVFRHFSKKNMIQNQYTYLKNIYLEK